MQAWNSVQVTNEESLHKGRAGTVMRVEKRGDVELVQVRLDESADAPYETEPFDPSELAIL
ncbi:hypothetical protein [Simplicispira suum]|uniref:DUF4926 domain-containing protein n=1 Tax=Simplicispira suum TaxID=2109915 RepID=A0A2S0N3J8_9BURK|nr:hypothetical protein [Simplicispira suum]AVO42738.1 hypothetical protein C6571_16835 [Simplicispira suum]